MSKDSDFFFPGLMAIMKFWDEWAGYTLAYSDVGQYSVWIGVLMPRTNVV